MDFNRYVIEEIDEIATVQTTPLSFHVDVQCSGPEQSQRERAPWKTDFLLLDAPSFLKTVRLPRRVGRIAQVRFPNSVERL